MKLHEIVDKSGDKVMEFSDYISNPEKSGIAPKLVPRFEVLGALLFKKGWKFGLDQFTRDNLSITLPNANWMKRGRSSVRVTFMGHGRYGSFQYDVDDAIHGLDAALDKVTKAAR